jgi:hypothetical protein
MKLPHLKIRLLHVMVAVAVLACFFALLVEPSALLVIVVMWSLVLAAIFWASVRGQRVAAFRGFAIASLVVNGSLAGLSIFSYSLMGVVRMALGSFLGLPMILGFGVAWSAAATRRGAVHRRSPVLTWPIVIALAIMPLTMLFTHWPLHLAFLVSRPALDRLADQVANGQAPTGPVRAGLFIVVSTALDPTTGNIGLIIDPDPAGRSGFVRIRQTSGASPAIAVGPLYNLAADLPLNKDWHFQNED